MASWPAGQPEASHSALSLHVLLPPCKIMVGGSELSTRGGVCPKLLSALSLGECIITPRKGIQTSEVQAGRNKEKEGHSMQRHGMCVRQEGPGQRALPG